MKRALLLVDLQNDFCHGGALPITDADLTIKVANRLIHQFKQRDLLVIASLDWHPIHHKSFAINSGTKIGQQGELNGLNQIWWPVHCVQNTIGAKLHPHLYQTSIDRFIFKGKNPEIDSYSAFFDNGKRQHTGLEQWLNIQNVTQLTIMGLTTDYCVKFTVLDALELGYQVEVVVDGCRGVNLQVKDSQNAFDEMAKWGAKLI